MGKSSFQIVDETSAVGLARNTEERFDFLVPRHWSSDILNQHAAEAGEHVLLWFEGLGCTEEQLKRARKFNVAGYVGIPFPLLKRNATFWLAQYLSLWLAWDDADIETLLQRWRITAVAVYTGYRPNGMTHFDEGWLELLRGFAQKRSKEWINAICEGMAVWCDAAVKEARAKNAYKRRGRYPFFAEQLKMRVDTIGMYVTVRLIEHALGFELPAEFHNLDSVRRLTWLANLLVGIGNDVFSFGKDWREGQINLISTLMHGHGLSLEGAIAYLVQRHNDAVKEFDRLADDLSSWSSDVRVAEAIKRWLEAVRYACIGFSRWEAQAPRYTKYVLVVVVDGDEKVIKPQFVYI